MNISDILRTSITKNPGGCVMIVVHDVLAGGGQ